jgi:hypothetical protein
MLRKNCYDQVSNSPPRWRPCTPAEVDYDWIARALQNALERPVADRGPWRSPT